MLYPLYNYYLDSPLSLIDIINDFVTNFYLKEHGSNKVDKIIRTVQNSSKVLAIDAVSIQQKSIPNYMDFGSAINSVPWFLFQSNETQALAILIAAREWNERVNKMYHFCDDNDIRNRALRVFEKFSIYKEMSQTQYDAMRTTR